MQLQQLKQFTTRLLAGLLVCFFIAGNLPVWLFHQHHNESEHVSHQPSDESDPCHLAIYHPEVDQEHKCHDRSHIQESGHHCYCLQAILKSFRENPVSEFQSVRIQFTGLTQFNYQFALICDNGYSALFNKGSPLKA